MRPTAPRRPTFRRRLLDGFTLIELLVVITIIAILAGMLLGAIMIGRETARKSASKQLVHQVALALEQYADNYGTPPPEKARGNLYSPECLTVFLAGGIYSGEANHPAIRAGREFLDRKLKLLTDANKNGYPEIVDAWGMPICYNRGEFAPKPGVNPLEWAWQGARNEPIHNPNSYDVLSGNTYGRKIVGDPAKVTLSTYEVKMLEHQSSFTSAHNARYPYKYEYVKSAATSNKENVYIGNW